MAHVRPILAILPLSLLGLSACASDPAPLTATPQAYVVTIDDDIDELNEANEEARLHCAQYGRAAILDAVGEIDGERIASFSCAAD
ncbi:hypothetical protein L2U69_15700 [Zavarzinia compransoris]|uniref:hypothetical protein n=1 Tax=Zavarzinia marina TaxID=2911065 RepID=UPI001F1C9CF5|nr:hypothetical protein [Zavarzinia marina]MCF4167096.1 hypothetical protein [Zavarzinia marina]